MQSISLGFILIIFLFIGMTFGFNKALASIPFLFFIFVLVWFFGWFVMAFWPLILIIVLINYLSNKNNPKTTKRRTYYYKFDRTEDFDEFFRKAGQQSGGYSYGGSTGGNPFGYAEDKTKYYKVLGVNPNATKEEIKKAYRELVKQHHPDKFTNAPEEERAYHEKRIKEINEAYDKLSKDFS